MGRYQRDAAPLLPDRGQGEDETLAVQEPLVARYALRHHPRALHRPNPLWSVWQRDLRHLLRPARKQARRDDERRRWVLLRPRWPAGGGVLPEALRWAALARCRRRHKHETLRPRRRVHAG